MKLYHYSILFVIVASVFITLLDISYAEMATVKAETQKLDDAFSKAVDAAVQKLVLDEKNCIYSSKEQALTTFYQTMFTCLDLNMDSAGQLQLKLYLPCIAIVDTDGLYLCYWEYQVKTGLYQTWSNRIAYTAETKHYQYEFTLGSLYRQYDKENGRWEEHEIETESMMLLQKETICQTIETQLLTVANEHNLIASQYQIQYQFSLPAVDQSVFNRAIKAPSFLVLFQGYPLIGTDNVYERYVFCGASLHKSTGYVVTKKEWYYQYHLPTCEKIKDASELMYCRTKKDCALQGAFPCPHCIDQMEQYDFMK